MLVSCDTKIVLKFATFIVANFKLACQRNVDSMKLHPPTTAFCHAVIGVNSYWAQGLKPPTFMIMGLAYMTSPPTFVT